jgi:hypothetical protein
VNPESLPLKDIHLPAPVGWWPPAPGWWLLALVAVLIVAGLWWWVRRPRPAVPPATLALRELDAIAAEFAAHEDPHRLAAELSTLIRRFVLAEEGRSTLAGVTGQRWLEYLDERAGQPEFTAGPGRALIDAPYRPAADFDAAGLMKACARLLGSPGTEVGR